MIRGLANLVMTLAAATLPRSMRDWGRAMRAELAAIERPMPAMGFALGCFACALREALTHIISPLHGHATARATQPARSEIMSMPSRDSLLQRPRTLGILCAMGATGLGLTYMAAAGAPPRYLIVNSAALVLGLLVLAGLAHTPRQGALLKSVVGLAIGITLMLTALLGISAEGVTRWISIGGVLIQPSLLLVPALAVRFARSGDGASTLAIAIAALALALQPDRAMAGALASGLALLALARPERNVLIALAAAVTGLAVALLRPDQSPAMPYVDQIVYSSFELHAFAGAAVVGGLLLMMVPALAGYSRTTPDRAAFATFGGVWAAVALAAALGNYPTPLVGYGGSAILGYLISLIALPTRSEAEAPTSERPAGAAHPHPGDRRRILRAGL